MDYEYKVDISGAEYSTANKSLIALKITRPLFERFGVGNTCAATVEIEVENKESIPRKAVIAVYAKEIGSSDWSSQGIFYLDYSEIGDYTTKLTGYDAMMKGEVIYLTTGEVGQWPRRMADVADEIAHDVIGVAIDSRTEIPDNYLLEYPNEYSCRELLSTIAAACGGNWIITAENKLLLVPLFDSMPIETNFLTDESGNSLLFPDGTRILV